MTVVDAIVQLLSRIWSAWKARRMAKASAELPRGEELNKQMDADVAELERLHAKDTAP
jgi:hypothetical protein